MAYTLNFKKAALEGVEKLKATDNREVIDEFLVQLSRLEKYGVKAGLPLEYKHGMDLRGYYKIYFGGATWRIVVKASDERIEVVDVIAVGQRESMEVYKLAASVKDGCT